MVMSFLVDLWGNGTMQSVASVAVGHESPAPWGLAAGLVNGKGPRFLRVAL